MTLLLGSLGYSLYIGSYLAMEIHPNAGGFVIAASSILGTALCPMWTTRGPDSFLQVSAQDYYGRHMVLWSSPIPPSRAKAVTYLFAGPFSIWEQ